MTVGVTRQAVSVLEGELLQFCLQILEGVVQQEALVIAASTFNGIAFGKNFKYIHIYYTLSLVGLYILKFLHATYLPLIMQFDSVSVSCGNRQLQQISI